MFERIRDALKKNKEIPIQTEQEQEERKTVTINRVEAGHGFYELPFPIEISEEESKKLNPEKIMFTQLQELKKFISKQNSEMNKLKYKVSVLAKQVALLKASAAITDEEE